MAFQEDVNRLYKEQVRQGQDLAGLKSDSKNIVGIIKEIKTQTTKTNGHIRNHEGRLISLEKENKDEDKQKDQSWKKKDFLIAAGMLILVAFQLLMFFKNRGG